MSEKQRLVTFLKREIKKADILLVIVLLLMGLAMTFFFGGMSTKGDKAVISVGGKLYGIYSLKKDRTIVIRKNGHINVVSIKDGKVRMDSASCKNQLCVKHKAITASKQQIVCLPNRVMIRIVGKDSHDQVDAFSQP